MQLFPMRTVIKGNEMTLHVVFRKSSLLTEEIFFLFSKEIS